MNMFKPVKAKNEKEYIDSIEEPRKSEIIELDGFIKKAVPSLKSNYAFNMLGYGMFHYKSKSGREGDWPVISLASQKNYISVYVCSVKDGKYVAEVNKQRLQSSSHKSGTAGLKEKLGKVSVGKSCIRFKKLEDVNLEELKRVLQVAEKEPGL